MERDARRYRRKGLTGSAGWLLQVLDDDGVADRSVLEVGGGIGSLQIELLEAGASHATNVEIIDSYEATARSLIAEHGLEARVERHIADLRPAPRPHPGRRHRDHAPRHLLLPRSRHADSGSLLSGA